MVPRDDPLLLRTLTLGRASAVPGAFAASMRRIEPDHSLANNRQPPQCREVS
jgi:hypothetical protein